MENLLYEIKKKLETIPVVNAIYHTKGFNIVTIHVVVSTLNETIQSKIQFALSDLTETNVDYVDFQIVSTSSNPFLAVPVDAVPLFIRGYETTANA